jgi:hypothetical protein
MLIIYILSNCGISVVLVVCVVFCLVIGRCRRLLCCVDYCYYYYYYC